MRSQYKPKPSPHGPVKVIYSKVPNPIQDPDTPIGHLAKRFRQHPPGSEWHLREALRIFEPFGIFFQTQVVLAGQFIGDFYCKAERKILIEVDGIQA